jgi:hypothetical protein
MPSHQQLNAELLLSGMLSALFALAARGAVTKEVLDQWRTGAEGSSVSAIVGPWLAFVKALFISNTLNAEAAVRDQSLTWTWQAVASIRVAVDTATRPTELLTIHNYWTQVLRLAAVGLFVLPDIEHLVTSAWQRLCENRFLLRAPALTVPELREACASASKGWPKIGEVLTAACDAVPTLVPPELRERFRKLWQ